MTGFVNRFSVLARICLLAWVLAGDRERDIR